MRTTPTSERFTATMADVARLAIRLRVLAHLVHEALELIVGRGVERAERVKALHRGGVQVDGRAVCEETISLASSAR